MVRQASDGQNFWLREPVITEQQGEGDVTAAICSFRFMAMITGINRNSEGTEKTNKFLCRFSCYFFGLEDEEKTLCRCVDIQT